MLFMSPQPLVQFPQYPQEGMSVEKSNHQYGYDGHQHRDDSMRAMRCLFFGLSAAMSFGVT